MNLVLIAVQRPVEAAGCQAVEALEVLGPVNGVRAEIPVPRTHVGGLERELETPLVFSGLDPCPKTLSGKRHLSADQLRQAEIFIFNDVGLVEIEHELA